MKKLCCLFFVLALVLVSLPGMAANPTVSYLSELQGDRFTRGDDGIITDHSSNLQWLEGPNSNMSWNDAQAWISSLGNAWRTPTLDELRGIFMARSTRIGGTDASFAPYDQWWTMALKLDPAFQIDKAYWVWSVADDATSAWYLSFVNGEENWNSRDYGVWGFRSFAVRLRSL